MTTLAKIAYIVTASMMGLSVVVGLCYLRQYLAAGIVFCLGLTFAFGE